MIKGFKNAQYKKFKTKQEAIDYMNVDTIENVIKQVEPTIIDSETSKTTQYVYCDGSCIHNGKPNAKAGIGIYFGDNDTRTSQID